MNPLLFVAAEPRECAPWVSKWSDVRDARLAVHWSRSGFYRGSKVLAIANGAGANRARIAVEAAPTPRAVCNIGFCGALNNSLRIGDIFIATEVIAEGSRLKTSSLETPPARSGAILSASHIAHTAARKQQLRESGAEAVEMEAAGALHAAEEIGVAFYCIRAVSDLAEEDFAIDFNRFLMPNGRFHVGRLVAHACLDPLKRFGELIRLSRRTALASNNLGEFLARCTF